MSTESRPARVSPQGQAGAPLPELASDELVAGPAGGRALAVARIATGFIFLWAFLDKVFGFGYATTADRAWINGGEPTEGFLGNLQAGPFREMFQGWAGAGWADWLFMLGLLAVGVAVMLGIGLRISAVAGSLMMLLMWVAEWPLARIGISGEPTMSTNPIVDYHIIYALVLIACAAAYAGRTWGLGAIWERIGFVKRSNPWLL